MMPSASSGSRSRRSCAPLRPSAKSGTKERQEARKQNSARPSLPERLDRASERMAKRAAQMKAFAEVFKPFYEIAR